MTNRVPVANTGDNHVLSYHEDIRLWCDGMRNDGKSASTIDCYGRDLLEIAKTYCAIYGLYPGTADITGLGKPEIEDLLAFWSARADASTTSTRRFVALRRFAKHLGMTRNLDCSKLLSIQFPSVELVAPATIDHSDYDRLLFGSTQLEQSWQDARDIAIIALQGHTGLTTGEVVALNCEDIPIGAGIVVVCRTHLEPRFAEIPPMVEAAIRHYLKSSPFGPCDGEALFVNYRGTRLTARGLQIRFRSRRDAFGLPPEIVPRTLRHRFIQKLAAERTPANDIAGLAGVEVSTVHHHLRLSAMSKKERVRRSARKPIADAA